MAPESKQADDAAGFGQDLKNVASQHPGLPPSLDEIEHAAGAARSPAASPIDIRLRKGARSPVGLAAHHRQMTLKDVAGEYSGLTHMPKPRSQHQNSSPIPILRWGTVWLWIARQNVSTVYSRCKRTLYKVFMHVAWLLSLLWWQLLIGLFAGLISSVDSVRDKALSAVGQARLEELSDIHGILGGVIGFVLAFRVNMAYQSYLEGRRLVGQLMNGLREVVLEFYSLLPQEQQQQKAAAEEETAALLDSALEVRRLSNMLFAFVRQDVREARCGFIPGSDLEGMSFDPAKNYYMDPCRPRLWDLLDDGETVRYAKIPSRMRPCAVVSEIMQQITEAERHCSKAASPRLAVTGALKGILVVHESMARLNTFSVPYPFICILHISVFLFVYSTPFYYLFHTSTLGTLSCLFFLILSYYGLLVIADSFERPYSYSHGSFNLALEAFGQQAHDDMLQVAQLFSEDDESFIPEYLSSPPPPPAAAAAAAAAETGAKA